MRQLDRPLPAAPFRGLEASLGALVADVEKGEPGQGGASGKRDLGDLLFPTPSLLPALRELLGAAPRVFQIPLTCPSGLPLPSLSGAASLRDRPLRGHLPRGASGE